MKKKLNSDGQLLHQYLKSHLSPQLEQIKDHDISRWKLRSWLPTSCNNVAPVTNLCLGRATTRSGQSSQWSKKKVAVET